MKQFTRQSKIEEKVYEYLEDISDELDIPVNSYPEVYWLGKKTKYESLSISLKKEEFESLKKKKGSMYIYKDKVILIGEDNQIDKSEEAGHYLHLTTSNINFAKNRNKLDNFCLQSIVEMFGYFTSKMIVPTRKNEFSRYKDRLPLKEFNGEKNIDLTEPFYYYQQGYTLGEKLFNSYVVGEIKKSEIKNLFYENFNEKYSPTSIFIDIKKKLWN